MRPSLLCHIQYFSSFTFLPYFECDIQYGTHGGGGGGGGVLVAYV